VAKIIYQEVHACTHFITTLEWKKGRGRFKSLSEGRISNLAKVHLLMRMLEVIVVVE
jgi:hypothetical protein